MEDNNNNEKNQLERLKQQFSGKGGNNNKNPKPPKNRGGGFNFMWVYGAIFLLFVGMSVFQYMSHPAQPTSYSQLTKFLEDNDVDKIKIINEKDVYIYIKPESLKKEEFKDVAAPQLGEGENPGQHYYFKIPADNFEKRPEDF